MRIALSSIFLVLLFTLGGVEYVFSNFFTSFRETIPAEFAEINVDAFFLRHTTVIAHYKIGGVLKRTPIPDENFRNAVFIGGRPAGLKRTLDSSDKLSRYLGATILLRPTSRTWLPE